MSTRKTDNHQRVYDLFCSLGPGQLPERYETTLGISRATLHDIVSDLNTMGLLDTDQELGTTWLGAIE